MITIQIIYVPEASEPWQSELKVAADLSIAEALQQSGIYQDFPELNDTLTGVGIYGIVKSLSDNVADGDRLEVYRELNFDPMESRRRRAAHKKAGILKKKHLKADRSKRFEYIEHKDKQIRRREYE
ncbi:MAG: RnfH family protein [Alcaligenaceae bacterium]|nr:RnfH family protein [Alcaligenaceae bacterium]